MIAPRFSTSAKQLAVLLGIHHVDRRIPARRRWRRALPRRPRDAPNCQSLAPARSRSPVPARPGPAPAAPLFDSRRGSGVASPPSKGCAGSGTAGPLERTEVAADHRFPAVAWGNRSRPSSPGCSPAAAAPPVLFPRRETPRANERPAPSPPAAGKPPAPSVTRETLRPASQTAAAACPSGERPGPESVAGRARKERHPGPQRLRS